MPGSTIQFTLRADTAQGVAALEKMRLALGDVGDEAAKSQKRAAEAAGEFGSVLNTVKGIVGGLGLTFGALAVGNQIREWTQSAMEGEKVWANVRTLLDETKVNAGALYDQLKNVSAEFGTTAELAKGMYLALSANIDPSKSVKFVEDAAKFAKAAVTDTYTSVDLLTTVINAYGLKVEETTRVSDILFQMVRKGKTTGDELAHSLGMVIPTAAALKVDLGQLGAAFATMTQMGLSAQITTTSLNQALLAFLNPSAQAKKLAKELHVEIDAAALKTKGLAGALGDLAKASKGNDEAIATFFGSVRALRAALALTGEQAGTYTEYLKDMANAAGLTDEAFKKQTATLKDQLEALWTNLGKTFKSLLPDTGSFANAIRDLNGFLEGGAAPINAYTIALTSFGVALAGLKIASVIKDWDNFKTAISGAASNMGLFGKAASVAGAAILGWNIGRWIADLTGADEALTKLWDKLGLFQGRVKEMQQLSQEALRKEAEALEKRARSLNLGKDEAQYGIDILKRSGWEDPQKYIDRIKPMLDAYDKIEKLAKKQTESHTAAAASVHQLTEDEKKLQEQWLKEIKPMSAITAEFEKYKAVGATVDQYAQAHWQEIVKATEAQKDFQEPLSKVDQELYNSALIWKKADDAMKSWHEGLKSITPAQLADTASGIRELMYKNQEEIGRSTIKNPLNGLVKLPTESQLDKNWAEFNRTMVGRAKETKTQVAEEVSTIFNDWTKGMADSIVEWKGFWTTMGRIAKDSAKSLLRILFDGLLAPVKDQMKRIGKSLADAISGLFKSGGVAASSYPPDFVGPTLAMMGKGSSGGGLFGLPKGGINGKGIGGAVGGAMTAGGMMLAMDSLNRGGAAGWVEGIGGGAMAGLAQGGPVGMAIGAAAAALAKGLPALVNAIKGKTAEVAGSMEVARDFGGINMTKDEFASYYQGLGLSESTAYGVRKDISSTPKFLVETLYPMAQAQGKVDAFLKSLEAVKTLWGTFNFRAAFELGQTTGDWTKLNEEFAKAFKNSEALNKALPNWSELLLAPSKAVTDLQNLQTAVKSLVPQTKSMYDQFVATGHITDELTAQIQKLGGNLDRFKDFADLTQTDKSWTDMVEHFKETGEIMPGILDMFERFGGNLEVINQAAALPGLHRSLDFIIELKKKLQDLAPQQNAVEKILAGNFDQSVVDALTATGLDPAKFKALAPVIGGMSNWDQLVSGFQSSGKLTDPMRQALLQYGGSAGKTAVERYGEGFNTISDNLLAQTKAAMDAAYQEQIKGLLGDLADAETKTTSEITRLTDAVTDEFDRVGNKIADAISAAASSVVAEIDVMLKNLRTYTTVAQPNGGNTGTVPGAGTENALRDNLDNGGRGDMPPVVVNINGDIFGNDDLDRRVADAVTRTWRNGGFAYMRG